MHAISQAILIIKIFRWGIKAGIFFAQLAIQSRFILSAECKYSGVQHGWTECELLDTPTFNSPAVQLLVILS